MEKTFTEAQVNSMLDDLHMEAVKLFQKHTEGMVRTGQQFGIPSTMFSSDLRAAKRKLQTEPSSPAIPTPKVFLTKWNGNITVAFRIDNQTFTLYQIKSRELSPMEEANWLANMLRSAFRQERLALEDDPLLSMFNDNEPI